VKPQSVKSLAVGITVERRRVNHQKQQPECTNQLHYISITYNYTKVICNKDDGFEIPLFVLFQALFQAPFNLKTRLLKVSESPLLWSGVGVGCIISAGNQMARSKNTAK